MADEWLPPTAFLPPGRISPTASGWTPWTSSQGTPHRPRRSGLDGPSPSEWSPQQVVNAWTAAHAADKVFDSVDDLAAAWHASMASLTAMPEFHTWQRGNPTFKPQLARDLWTPQQGPRRVIVLLDTGPTHCLICARLTAGLGLRPLGRRMELQLASFSLADAELCLEVIDDVALAALKAEYADVPGMPPGRGMELELESGNAPMPRSRPVKRLSDGELAEICAQLINMFDRGWIQHSTAGLEAAVVFARKPDGSWRICYDYRGLNAITRPAVEPLPHIDALLSSAGRH
jgi:hypothetical protein